MAQWAYKVAYIDYRGRISSEGLETLKGDNERRSAFAGMRRCGDAEMRSSNGWDCLRLKVYERAGRPGHCL